jgi:hemerythrin
MFGWFKAAASTGAGGDLLPWSDDYLLGIKTIDEDHRNLFEIVNRLHDAFHKRQGPQTIKITFSLLTEYVAEHFAREEQLMHQIGYPGIEEHRMLHAGFIQAFFSTKQSYIVAPKAFDFDSFLEFLRKWLVHHVLVEDRKYVHYVMQEDSKDED